MRLCSPIHYKEDLLRNRAWYHHTTVQCPFMRYVKYLVVCCLSTRPYLRWFTSPSSLSRLWSTSQKRCFIQRYRVMCRNETKRQIARCAMRWKPERCKDAQHQRVQVQWLSVRSWTTEAAERRKHSCIGRCFRQNLCEEKPQKMVPRFPISWTWTAIRIDVQFPVIAARLTGNWRVALRMVSLRCRVESEKLKLFVHSRRICLDGVGTGK